MSHKLDKKYEAMRKERLMKLEVPDSLKKEVAENMLSDNILEHIAKKRLMTDAERHFWRYNKLWRHIEDHICHAGDCVLVDRVGSGVKGTSASSGVRLEEVSDRVLDDEKHLLCFKFEADYWTDECYDEYDRTTRTEWVYAPAELAVEWNDKKWKAFLAIKKNERNERIKKEEMKILYKLLKKYSKEATEILSEKMK